MLATATATATATAAAAARPVDVESLANLVVIMEQSITPPRSDNPRQPRVDWGVRSRRRGAEEGGGLKYCRRVSVGMWFKP